MDFDHICPSFSTSIIASQVLWCKKYIKIVQKPKVAKELLNLDSQVVKEDGKKKSWNHSKAKVISDEKKLPKCI